MYMLDRNVHVADRLPVSVLRTGAEALELPNAAELARRHGDRWLVIEASSPNGHVRSAGAPAAFWLCRRGKATVTLGDSTFQLEAGQWLWSEAGERLEVSTAGLRDASFVAIVAPQRLAARMHQRIAATPAVEPVIFAEHGNVETLFDRYDLDRIDRALLVSGSEWTLAEVGEAMLLRMLDRQRAFDAVIEKTSGRTMRHKRHLFARLNRVRTLVERGPVRDYSMRELASIAALSVWHFVRMFGQVYGETPHRFLTRIRLERASHLLATTDASIASVAERLGFENRCAFARLFRAHFGMPASVHRRQAKLAARTHAATDGVANAARRAPETVAIAANAARA